MSNQKTKSSQKKLEFNPSAEEKSDKEKLQEESSTLQEYPELFDLMFKNKDAKKNQDKKNFYKRKYGK